MSISFGTLNPIHFALLPLAILPGAVAQLVLVYLFVAQGPLSFGLVANDLGPDVSFQQEAEEARLDGPELEEQESCACAEQNGEADPDVEGHEEEHEAVADEELDHVGGGLKRPQRHQLAATAASSGNGENSSLQTKPVVDSFANHLFLSFFFLFFFFNQLRELKLIVRRHANNKGHNRPNLPTVKKKIT